MSESEKTVTQAIIAARDSLNESNWIKGNYFMEADGRLCMCAHGALQAQVNPLCATARNLAGVVPAGAPIAADAALAASAAGAAAREVSVVPVATDAGVTYADFARAWAGRPEWVDTDTARGNLQAHYVLGMAGLTAAFNDRPETTLDMVKDKFTSAAELAESLGLGAMPIADEKYPAKPMPRVEKPGTKRYFAQLFRKAATVLDTNEHTIGSLYANYDGKDCFCAMGAVAKAAGCDAADKDSFDAFLSKLFGGDWMHDHRNVIGESIITTAADRVLGKHNLTGGGWKSVWANNDEYGAKFLTAGGRITKPEAKAKIQEWLRTMAYMLEHGGKLPKRYRTSEEE